MASVALEFALPPQPDLVKLYILESTFSTGPFNVIDTVENVGTYPDYIDNYTTDLATNENYWFAIMWEDAKGAQGDISQPIQGNTQTIVGLIADRVQQRGASASNEVVIQEAEAVCEGYFGMNPYEVPLPVSYQVLSGLTYVTMARSMISEIATSTMSDTSGWTAGLVSMKSGTGSATTQQQFEWLLDMASKLLGIGVSQIAQMATPEIAGGMSVLEITNFDISRLLVTSVE